jgi:hypothetical protein
VGSDLADEPERRRLVAALTTLAGKAPGSLGECESVLDPVGEEVRLAEIHQEERLGNSVPHSLAGAHRVRPSGVAHSSQNFVPRGFSCWHRGHFICGASSGLGQA